MTNLSEQVVAPPPPAYRTIPLTQGKEAIVDAADYDYLMRWSWFAYRNKKTFYAARKEKGRMVRMHSAILRTGPDATPDHQNRNGLDNRRTNLRPANATNQCINQSPRKDNLSGFKGVRELPSGRYQARIRIDGVTTYLGSFPSKEAAAKAYDEAALNHYGEFAYLNFPLAA